MLYEIYNFQAVSEYYFMMALLINYSNMRLFSGLRFALIRNAKYCRKKTLLSKDRVEK